MDGRGRVELPRGIWVAVVVGVIVAGGVAIWYVWRRPHPMTPDERDIADPSHAANDLVEDVARWEDEGGAVVFE